MSELLLFPNIFIFSSLETFALQGKQNSEVKIFCVSMALIAGHSSLRTNSSSKIIAGSQSVLRVRKCRILLVNFNGQQQNLRCDMTEISL